MKKLIGVIFALLTLVILFPSCDNTESYADKLKNEKKNINKFIAENKIELIYQYPENGKFKSNQYLVDGGIYIQVVDTGNGKRVHNPLEFYTPVSVRYAQGYMLPNTDVVPWTNQGAEGSQPIRFFYGYSNSYLETQASDIHSFRFLSPALAYPLKYVGDSAVVKLIVPFNQGSTYQQSSYNPIYMGFVQYNLDL